MSLVNTSMDLDVTFFAQFALVLLLIVVLRPLLVSPLLQVLEARTEQIDGSRGKTRQLERQAQQDRRAHQDRLRQARHEVHHVREQLRQSGRERAQQLENAARLAIQQQQVRQRQALEQAEKQALSGLDAATRAQSRDLLQKLLGREVAA